MDSQKFPNGIWADDKREQLSAEALDRLDYLVAALKREGVYVDINLHVSREWSKAHDWPNADKLPEHDDKIIDVFQWPAGRYRYYRGRMNKRESFPLGLDAFEILGAGVAGLPLDTVRARLDKMGPKRVRRVERARPTPEHFRVGAGPRELWQRLDGKRTVGEWMRRYDQPEQLLTLCRTLYLLIESELAALD